MTTTALARRFLIDIDTAYPSTASWSQLTGVTEFAPKVEATLQDADDYDSDGWGGSEVTMVKWSAEITFLRQKDNVGAFPAAHQALLDAAASVDPADRRIHIRWYDRDGGTEAYEGTGVIQLERANSAVADLDAAKVTLTAAAGSAQLLTITNPLA